MVQFFTGTTINAETPVVIIGPQHEPRLQCDEPFLPLTNSLSVHARFHCESDSPLFNEWTGYVFFHVTAKGQRMEKLVQSIEYPKHPSTKHRLHKLFEMRIPGGEYLM